LPAKGVSVMERFIIELDVKTLETVVGGGIKGF